MYYPDGSAETKRAEKRSEHFIRHNRHNIHKRENHMGVEGQKVEDCDKVNGALGKVVADAAAKSKGKNVEVSAPAASSAAKVSFGKGFTRTAYYDAASGTAQGIVFMNHKGGQGSGTFDR